MPPQRPLADVNDGRHEPVVLGIDAGGTRTRAIAMVGDEVVFEGTGGPGNPKAVPREVLSASYGQALAGCPPPHQVGACIAGAGDSGTQARMADMLRDYFPTALIRVAPDYVAAFQAAPPGTHVCVIAGTGSMVCSINGDHYEVSGGNGWIIGDHGSASRLGRSALDWAAEHWEERSSAMAAQMTEIFETRDRRALVRALFACPTPAEYLARAAVVLTAAAERDEVWAKELLGEEMGSLAQTTARHIGHHIAGELPVNVALTGGVWASPSAVRAYTCALVQASTRQVRTVHTSNAPITGAVRFAARLR